MQQGTIYISGVIGEDTNLLDVIRQVKAQKNADSYLVKIDSIGGYVDVGISIFDYLKGLEKEVDTYTTKAFSIASVIFLAGEKRIIPEGAVDALMIHLPWTEVKGSSDVLSAHAEYLKEIENDLSNIYSEALEIDKNTIQSLLTSETYLDAAQALEMGFATMIQPQMKAVAMINNKENEDESLMIKISKEVIKKLNQVKAMLSGAKAELVLQDSTGVELIFPDLEANDMPAIDEKVTVDGKQAEGDYIMPDGSTIVVVAGVVTEIIEAETEEETEEEVENVDEEIDPAPAEDDRFTALENRITELENKISELMGETEAENKMLEVVELAAEKVTELENKYQALAKQVGSDFQHDNKKENNTTVKASTENKSRAWQILNS